MTTRKTVDTEPVPVAPVVPPILPPSPSNLRDPAWWTALLSFLVSFGTGVGVLVGHPWDNTAITAAIPSVAFLAAIIVPALFVHGSQQVKVARIQQGIHG